MAILAGALWLLGLTLALLYVASGLSALWREAQDTPQELAVDIGITALSFAGPLVGLLGLTDLLGRGSITVVVAVAVLLTARLAGRPPLWQLAECAHAVRQSTLRSPVWWVILALALATSARGMSIPQLGWDGVTYHLSYPASWVKHGGIVRFEGGGTWEVYETFPKGAESLYYLALVAFHNDLLVNLVNLPMWLLTALAVQVTAQRLGLTQRESEVTALIAVATPGMLAYITPAFVEVPKVCAMCAAMAAACRVLIAGRTRALIPMGIALGFALSIKLTVLTWAGPALVAVLWSMRERPREGLRYGAIAAAANLAVAGVWYVHNATRCGGNPIYPAPMPLASEGPLAGSIAAAWSLKETSVLSQASWGAVYEYLAIIPWHARYPLGPGWGILLAFPLALVLPVFASGRQARVRAAWLAALSTMLVVIYLITPWNGIYTKADTRFLAPAHAMSILACAAALAGGNRWLKLTVAAAGLVSSLGYLNQVPVVDNPSTSLPAWGVSAAVLAAWLAWQWRPAVGAAALAAALLLLPATHERREATRFDLTYDLHPLPPGSTALWKEVAHLEPGKLAFAAGGVDATEAWFFYPLHGPDLRHQVVYVDIQEDGDVRACHRRGVIRKHPHEQAWLERMDVMGVRYLVVTHTPPEAEWAVAHPERFELLAEAGRMRLFRRR